MRTKHVLPLHRDSIGPQFMYCKRGNICGTLIFAVFQQARIKKPRENICDILYAHFGHVGVVYWPCVLMQMGNILKSVWDLLVFVLPSYIHTCNCIIHWMILTLCSTKMTSEHLLSANLTTREYVFELPNAKN